MQDLRFEPSGPALGAVLRQLTQSLGCLQAGRGVDAALEAVAEQSGFAPEDLLGAACPPAGLRASEVRATVAEAAPRARRELPLVCWAEKGMTGGWMVLEEARFGRVRVWSSTTWLPQGWQTVAALEDLLGTEPVRWLRVESLLPASPLGRTEGEERPSPVRRLRGLMQLEGDAVAVVVVYAVAVGILSLATPLAIQVLINWLAFGALYQPVVILSIALLLCLGLAAGLRGAQRYVVELVQRRIFVRTVTDLGARLGRVRISSLDKVYGPELVNRFFDVLTLQKATKTLLIDGLTAALQAGVGLLLLAVYHPYLLVFDVVVIGLVGLALFPWLRAGQDSAIRESKHKYQVAAWIEEIARHPAVFKMGGLDLAERRLEALSRDYLESRAGHFSVFFRQYLGMQAVAVVVQVGLLLTAGWLVLEGQLTLGQLVAAEFIVTAALMGLAKFTEKLEVVYDLLAGVDKLGTLLDLEADRPAGILPEPSDVGAAVALRDVGFEWADARSPLFGAISLELAAGSRTAIYGDPGVGKSALGAVLTGMRTPTAGAVWRDGLPTSRLLPDALFAETRLLRPDSLVHGTVRDNVLLGMRDVSEGAIWDTLAKVNLADAVAGLPKGLETVLAPSGAPLSDTQVKGLILARALVAPPRLLVVDSLFDGLPPRIRGPLLAALSELDGGTTLVVLTEEPLVANTQDRVLELTEGGLHARPRLSTL